MDAVRIVNRDAVIRELDTYAPQARQNLERRAIRAGAKVVKRQMAFEADSSGHPHSFTKVRVRVSSSLRRGMVPVALVRPVSPLFNILEPGAGGHTIAPKSASVLAGRAGGSEWPDRHSDAGRKRGRAFFARGPVQHPGLRARPIVPGTMASAGAAAQAAMAAVILGNAPGQALGTGE